MRWFPAVVIVALVGVVSAAPKTAPTALVIAIDRSGSMQGARLTAAKQAAKAAFSALAPTDRIAVIAFDSAAVSLVGMQTVGTDRKAFDAKIDRLAAGGGTDFLPALELALTQLDGVKMTRKHVILLSDGEAPTDGLAELVDRMHKRGITVSTIGIGDAAEGIMKLVAEHGAGRVYMEPDLAKLSEAFAAEVARAIAP